VSFINTENCETDKQDASCPHLPCPYSVEESNISHAMCTEVLLVRAELFNFIPQGWQREKRN